MFFTLNKQETFDIKQTLECGQVFRFRKEDFGYILFSKNHFAKIEELDKEYRIETDDELYFRNYFDLDRDYKSIQEKYSDDPFVKDAIEKGKGIHLLRQDIEETIISFLISQNNNIPRIKKIIEKMCEELGEDMGEYHAFPALEKLSTCGEDFYKNIGCGYRAPYLDRVSKALINIDIESLKGLETPILREKLLSLYGVGRKVADCILLFGFSRYDVFPVDTWIKKVFENEYKGLTADKISTLLVKKYGLYSGFVQQWIFSSQIN